MKFNTGAILHWDKFCQNNGHFTTRAICISVHISMYIDSIKIFHTTAVQNRKTHFILSNTFFHKFLGIMGKLKKVDEEYISLSLCTEEIIGCIETACLEFFKSNAQLKYVETYIK
jgi:hypothetical protein